ncbi:MAG: T9SS type A sorting domain-containing protein, partial [Bacteroidota bacterium]
NNFAVFVNGNGAERDHVLADRRPQQQVITASLTDLQGRFIWGRTWTGTNLVVETLDFSHLAGGIYVLRVELETGVYEIEKLVFAEN